MLYMRYTYTLNWLERSRRFRVKFLVCSRCTAPCRLGNMALLSGFIESQPMLPVMHLFAVDYELTLITVYIRYIALYKLISSEKLIFMREIELHIFPRHVYIMKQK